MRPFIPLSLGPRQMLSVVKEEIVVLKQTLISARRGTDFLV
jgi:hypothetical protein